MVIMLHLYQSHSKIQLQNSVGGLNINSFKTLSDGTESEVVRTEKNTDMQTEAPKSPAIQVHQHYLLTNQNK
jgi:hypothetical protein